MIVENFRLIIVGRIDGLFGLFAILHASQFRYCARVVNAN